MTLLEVIEGNKLPVLVRPTDTSKRYRPILAITDVENQGDLYLTIQGYRYWLEHPEKGWIPQEFSYNPMIWEKLRDRISSEEDYELYLEGNIPELEV